MCQTLHQCTRWWWPAASRFELNKEEMCFNLSSVGQPQILCFSPTLTNILKKSLGHVSCSVEQSFPVYLDFMRKKTENFEALSIAVMPDPVEKNSKIRQDHTTKRGTTGAMRAKPKRTAGPSCMCWRYQNQVLLKLWKHSKSFKPKW